MKLVPIINVKQGDCLAKNILDVNGKILLKEGVFLTKSYLSIIEHLEISSIYIKTEQSKVEYDEVIKSQPQQENIKEFFNDSERGSLNSKNTNSNVKKLLNETSSRFKSIETITRSIIGEVKKRETVMNSLTSIYKMDNYTYQHSINVAQYSLELGIQLQLTQDELYTLCIGALLHDVGKLLIPVGIIQKAAALTNEEFKTIKEHTTKGYDYLRGYSDIPESAKSIVLQHHERMDGRGYPNNTKGEDISRFSRIVAIANVYDSLTSDRPYRKTISPNDALEYILSNGDAQFDYEIVKAFSKAIVPYPMGTRVNLSNDLVGIVSKNHQSYSLRPSVKIIQADNKIIAPYIMNLKESNYNVTIVGRADALL